MKAMNPGEAHRCELGSYGRGLCRESLWGLDSGPDGQQCVRWKLHSESSSHSPPTNATWAPEPHGDAPGPPWVPASTKKIF